MASTFRFRHAALGFSLFFFAACMDSKELRAISTTAPVGPNCSSCHAYPLRDVHHSFHMFMIDSIGMKTVNGSVTCVDCHNDAMRVASVSIVDTLFADPFGNLWSSYDFPANTDIRTYPIGRIDTLVHHRPVPLPVQPGRIPLIQEWMTGLAHLNSQIDVLFDPRVSDTSRFAGQTAEYDVQQQTCSAVACHEREKPYRWAAPSQGLPGLTGN